MELSNLAIELLKKSDISGARNVAKANKIILNLHEMIELKGGQYENKSI